MPYYYYTREIEIGENGEKIGLLMIDSCLLLCSNYTYGRMERKDKSLEIIVSGNHDSPLDPFTSNHT